MGTQKERNQVQEHSHVELWLEVKAGNPLAFSHLYGKYSKELFQYGYHWTDNKTIIEDVIHDVFVNIWTTKDQLKINSLKPYLLTCVRNGILRKLSGEKRFSSHLAEDNEINLKTDEEFEEEEMLQAKRIREILDQLTDRQREIIHLKFYQNLSYSEISELLGIDLRHAYNLASKAYSFIKHHISSTATTVLLLVNFHLSY